MANEISLSVSLGVIKDSLRTDFKPSSLRVTLANDPYVAGAATIGTTAELVSLGDITTAGYACFRNLSSTTSTNYVELGVGTTISPQMFAKLRPAEYAICPLTSTTLVARATGGSVNLQYLILST